MRPSLVIVDPVSADLNVEGVHKLWRNADPQPRHPLAPLVRAWRKRPVEVEDPQRPGGPLVPGALGSRATQRPASGQPVLAGSVDSYSGERAIRPFPRFRSRRGERPACSRPVALPPQRFGDLLKALYPNPGFYRRSRHFAAIYEAAKSLESARVPWEHPDGSGAMRRVVYARDLPRDGRLDDWVQFVVDLPPGSERGVLVDRTALPCRLRFGGMIPGRCAPRLREAGKVAGNGGDRRGRLNGTPW